MKHTFFLFLLLVGITTVSTAQTVVNSRTASLIPGGYEISGSAIVEELCNGALRLRLDDAYNTPAGPDVRIFLSDDPIETNNAIEIVNIGSDGDGINHFSGELTVDVPEGVSIDQYDYVVFVCVAFNLHWASGTLSAYDPNGTGAECTLTVSGIITGPSGDGLSGVVVRLDNQTSTTTNVDGSYEFTNITPSSTLTITPALDDNHETGISTGDILSIQKHLLAIEPFTSDLQYIAADISNNGNISTGDIVQLQRLILGIHTMFGNNQSYRFLDSGTGTIDLDNLPESISINNIQADVSNANFIGVKVGDVNGAAN